MYPTTSLWSTLTSGGSVAPAVVVRSSLGADPLGEVTPESWEESASSDGRKVSSTLSLSVADPLGNMTRGLRAPLGWMGQRLAVRAGFAKPGAFATGADDSRQSGELVPMGSWLITDPGSVPVQWVDYGTMQVSRGGVVTPSAIDLLAILDGDDFTALTAPLTGATVRSEVLRIVGGRLPVAASWPGVDGSTAYASTEAYGDNRLGALCTVLNAAGAVAWVNRSGALQPLPLSKTAVDRVLPKAVIESKRIVGGRDGLFNQAVVTGTATDGTPLIGIATEVTGPLAADPAKFGTVTKRFSNPLVHTQGGLDATAATYLAQGIAARAVRVDVSLDVPDYAIDPLDLLTVLDVDQPLTGTVQSLKRGGSGMSLVLSVPWLAAIA